MDGAIYNTFSLETIVLGVEYYCRNSNQQGEF